MLRVLLGVNLMALMAALVRADTFAAWLAAYFAIAAWVEPPLFASLLLGALLRDVLWRLPRPAAQAAALGLAVAPAWLMHFFLAGMGLDEPDGAWRVAVLAAAAAALLLAYFSLRARAFSPAIGEARLAALNARIRPHFLFNALNAVLSLIRAEPRRAEEALETLADLFRSALRDARELVPLSEEIALGRQYLELEKLRLGERLQVAWEVADVPLDLPIPPLMLQPLLENAVYHGIEPASEGGTVRIAFSRRGDQLRIEIANPLPASAQQAPGNRMALANIRERLELYYDLEARLEIESGPASHLVRIVLPCRHRPDRSPS